MRKLIFWTSVISGVAAAYLLYKKGVPAGTIASKIITNPVGTLINEL